MLGCAAWCETSFMSTDVAKKSEWHFKEWITLQLSTQAAKIATLQLFTSVQRSHLKLRRCTSD